MAKNLTPAASLLYLDEMMSKVDQIRLGIFQIFKAAVSLPAQNPENVKTRVKSHIESVGKGITILTEYSNKLKDVIQETQEKTPQYPRLDNSLLVVQDTLVPESKWAKTMNKRATSALATFGKKRSSLFPMKRDRSHFHLPPAKRQALVGQIDQSELFETLENTVSELTKRHGLKLTILFSPEDEMQPIGITVRKEGVFQAWIQFKNPILCHNDTIELSRVKVFADNEIGGMWKTSKFLLYQSITRQAASAIQHNAEFFPGKPVEHIVKWISCYSDLYSRPCKRCGKIFFHNENQENPLTPPCVRSLKNGSAFHLDCYSE